MRVWRNLAELSGITPPVHLAIGVFDGLHLGHQAVIRDAMGVAEGDRGQVMALTFDPHPMTVLAPERAPKLLTPTPLKLSLLGNLGVDHVVAQPFDLEFSRVSARDFFELLTGRIPTLAGIHVGDGWTFGYRRGGNVDLLRQLGAAKNIAIHAARPVLVNGELASSTLIRQSIAEGSLDRAASMLGRDYSVLGHVVTGQRLGRKIGFPTANLALPECQLPPHGVYAARVRRGSTTLNGVANLGVRPTVETAVEPRLEVHLFEFNEDLEGEALELAFVRHLRGERKFPGLTELKAQIALDCDSAKKVLLAKRPALGEER